MTPNKLAAIGRALYGNRWQTPLADDLNVADRTMRRWLAGDTDIPDNLEQELRQVLERRQKAIANLLGYTVRADERTIFHAPTAACFRYDDAGNLTLLNPEMIGADMVPALKRGAIEALRQEHERDPRIEAMWLGRPAPKLWGLTENIRIGIQVTTIMSEVRAQIADQNPQTHDPRSGWGTIYVAESRRDGEMVYAAHAVRGRSSYEFRISEADFDRLREMNVPLLGS